MTIENTAENLRQLLLDLYVSGAIGGAEIPNGEQERLLNSVLDAAEGRPFQPLGLPFPKSV